MTAPDRASLEVVFGDGRYHDTVCEGWFAADPGVRLEVVGRPAGAVGLVPNRERRVVERTFGRLVTNRRCVREYEKRVWGREARARVAAFGMMPRRLKKNHDMGRGV